MLTIIGYLLILLTSIFASQDIPGQNFLLNMGTLILSAYVCGELARAFSIPAVLGYIVAGVLVGADGVGLVSAGFTDRIRFINDVLFMVLIAHIVSTALKPKPPQHMVRIFFSGMLSAALACLMTLGMVVFLTVPQEVKILISLFAASFSPVIISRFTGNDLDERPLLIMSFGGFLTATVLWGIITAFMDPSVTSKVRLASMPVFIALLSTITGLLWGYAAEKLFNINRNKSGNLYPVAIMFLMYPLVYELGFDSLFIAIGVGLHNGLISERMPSNIEESEFLPLMVFSFFGMHISLQNMVILDNASWSLVTILVAVLALTRTLGTRIAANVIPRTSRKISFVLLLSLSGPLAVIHMRRFLPGYQTLLPPGMGVAHIYTVFSSVMLILVLLAGIVTAVIHYRKKQMEASQQ